MDWKKAEILIEKYWMGASSVEEEKWLRDHRHVLSDSKDGQDLARLFQFLEDEKESDVLGNSFDEQILNLLEGDQVIPERRVESLFQKIRYWPAAAVLALLMAAAIALETGPFTSRAQDTFEDPRQAFEATKMALLLVSEKLNEGKAQAARIHMISEIEQNLKSEQK